MTKPLAKCADCPAKLPPRCRSNRCHQCRLVHRRATTNRRNLSGICPRCEGPCSKGVIRCAKCRKAETAAERPRTPDNIAQERERARQTVWLVMEAMKHTAGTNAEIARHLRRFDQAERGGDMPFAARALIALAADALVRYDHVSRYAVTPRCEAPYVPAPELPEEGYVTFDCPTCNSERRVAEATLSKEGGGGSLEAYEARHPTGPCCNKAARAMNAAREAA